MRFNHHKLIRIIGEQQESYSLLIEQAQAGNSEAFFKLYRRYWPLVRRLWQKAPVAGLELADWEQEAQLTIIEALKAYRGTNSRQFSSFLKHCLTNRLYDLYRRNQASKRIPANQLLPLKDTYTDYLIDPLHCPPDEIIHCHRIIKQFINECSDFEGQVLAYLHCGYSVNEAAQHFNCTKRSIQGALNRCHHKLLKYLD